MNVFVSRPNHCTVVLCTWIHALDTNQSIGNSPNEERKGGGKRRTGSSLFKALKYAIRI